MLQADPVQRPLKKRRSSLEKKAGLEKKASSEKKPVPIEETPAMLLGEERLSFSYMDAAPAEKVCILLHHLFPQLLASPTIQHILIMWFASPVDHDVLSDTFR